MRKTKIVATIGPASNSEEKLKELSKAGLDVARFNFSHVDQETHGKVFDRLKDLDLDVATMLDTKGPEIRLGEVEEDTWLMEGENVVITTEEMTGNSEKLFVSYGEFPSYVSDGDVILIDDGEVELKAVETGESFVKCRIVFGGKVTSRKSVNIPGKEIGLKAPTEKDISDIKYGCDKGFDLLALSFVKSAEDVRRIRQLLKENNSDMKIISKIEHFKAVENIEEIIEASDGIMVARGDLGVETPASGIPLLQKRIIKICNRHAKPVITATQMLKSMTEHPRATRAETSDVANAVLDGTDAVMLSEETAMGKFPVKSVDYMAEVVERVEKEVGEEVFHTVKTPTESITDAIAKNVWQLTRELRHPEVKYIVAHTSSGHTARNVAKYRPSTPIIAFTNSPKVQKQLKVVWGVTPMLTEFGEYFQDMIIDSAEILEEKGLVGDKDMMIFTAGVPEAIPGNTNILEVRRLEEIKEEKRKVGR